MVVCITDLPSHFLFFFSLASCSKGCEEWSGSLLSTCSQALSYRRESIATGETIVHYGRKDGKGARSTDLWGTENRCDDERSPMIYCEKRVIVCNKNVLKLHLSFGFWFFVLISETSIILSFRWSISQELVLKKSRNYRIWAKECWRQKIPKCRLQYPLIIYSFQSIDTTIDEVREEVKKSADALLKMEGRADMEKRGFNLKDIRS